MNPDQDDPEQHKQRASRQFGPPRPQGFGNGTTDVETGSDLHSTGRKTIHFVISQQQTATAKNRLHPHKTQSLPSAAATTRAFQYVCA